MYCPAASGANPKGYPQGHYRSRSCKDRRNFPNDCQSIYSGPLRTVIYIFHAFEDFELRTTLHKSRSRSQKSWASRGFQIAVSTAQSSSDVSCTSLGLLLPVRKLPGSQPHHIIDQNVQQEASTVRYLDSILDSCSSMNRQMYSYEVMYRK